MEIKRYAEHFRCDALRLAFLLGGENATYTDGIGNTEDFPLVPKQKEILAKDVRFIRVENGEEYYEVAFVLDVKPTLKDSKYRNKSYHRVAIGKEIRRARLNKGMTLEELAEKTNLREHSLSRIEDGYWDIDISLLGVIIDALGVQITLK